MWCRVWRGVEVLGPVVGVDLVALEGACRVVAQEAAAAGVDVDGLLSAFCTAGDAVDYGFDRGKVVRGSAVDDDVVCFCFFPEKSLAVDRWPYGFDILLLQCCCCCCFSTDQRGDIVVLCE